MNKEIFPESYVNVKSISPNWITENFLDFMDLKIEDFKEKDVTSIWGWFWIFEMDIAKNWARVTIVDPLFSNMDWLDSRLKENIDWIESKAKWKMKEKFWIVKNEIIHILSTTKDKEEKKEAKERLEWYNERQAEIEEYIRRRKIMITHLKNWKENQKHYWINLNPSSWNKIKWIDEGSQNFVVIWHTLWHIYSKSSWNIIDFLSEALKILSPKWKLYIIDYIWDLWRFERIIETTPTKIFYKENKWSFVCCFDKIWLSEFLENWIK